VTYRLTWGIEDGTEVKVVDVELLADLLEVEISLRTQTDLSDDEIKALFETGETREEPWESMDGSVSWIRMTKLEGQ